MKPIALRAGTSEWSMCRRKTAYASVKQATDSNRGMHVYRCPFCGKWHLATKRKDATQ